MTQRAALYKRVSSYAQVKEGYSLQFQAEIMRDFCQRQGLEVAAVYEDSGRTGSNTEREGLQQLVKDAKTRSFEVVLIFRVDRFSRDPLDLLYLVQELNKREIKLRSVTEAVDASDPAGELMLTILGAIGKFVRANIMQNAALGKTKRAEYGRYNGGRVPFGYIVGDDGHFAPDSADWWNGMTVSSVVGFVFDAFLRISATQGGGIRGVARWLDSQGVPTPTRSAAGWGPGVVRQLLRNPVYTGDYAYAKTKQAMHGTAQPRPSGEWVVSQDAHEPLVTRDTWKRVQALLDNNRSITASRSTHPGATELLTGFLRCSLCGSALVARYPSKKTRYLYYTCGSRYNASRRKQNSPCAFPFIRSGDLERAVWDLVTTTASDAEAVRRLLEVETQDNGRLALIEHRLEQARKAIAKAEHDEERLMDSALQGVFRPELIAQRAADVRQRRDAAQGKIALAERELRDALRAQPYEMADAAKLRAYIAPLLAGKALTLQTKRDILSLLVGPRGIAVAPDGVIEMRLRVPSDILKSTVLNIVRKEPASRHSSLP